MVAAAERLPAPPPTYAEPVLTPEEARAELAQRSPGVHGGCPGLLARRRGNAAAAEVTPDPTRSTSTAVHRRAAAARPAGRCRARQDQQHAQRSPTFWPPATWQPQGDLRRAASRSRRRAGQGLRRSACAPCSGRAAARRTRRRRTPTG